MSVFFKDFANKINKFLHIHKIHFPCNNLLFIRFKAIILIIQIHLILNRMGIGSSFAIS